jgi:hypothetical protein
MENSMTIRLSKFSSSDTLIKHLLKRAEAIDFLVELLKQGEKARVELDRIFAEKFGWTVGSATALLDSFKTYGWVKSEVRAEEEIMIDVDECNRWLKVKLNGDGTATVQKPYGDKPFIVYDPEIETTEYGWMKVTGKRKIQVKRKYYTWVA